MRGGLGIRELVEEDPPTESSSLVGCSCSRESTQMSGGILTAADVAHTDAVGGRSSASADRWQGHPNPPAANGLGLGLQT